MLCAGVAERRDNVGVSVVEAEPAFFNDAPGLDVSVVVSTPDGLELQLIEATRQQCSDSFRNEALSPVGLADPVAYLGVARLHVGGVESVGEHYSATAHGLA